jgi:hypothetical protein
MIGDRDNENNGAPSTPERDIEMQAAVTPDQSNLTSSSVYRVLFDRFWDEVAPFNNFSPEAARALLSRETPVHQQFVAYGSGAEAVSDPWTAVRAALTERAAGRKITRSA